MPIYEYECAKCGEIIEELQKFSDPPLKKCCHCGGKVNKLMSLNTFHLKGSGWYVTDYAGKNASTAESKKDSPKEGAEVSAKKDDTSKKTDKTDA